MRRTVSAVAFLAVATASLFARAQVEYEGPTNPLPTGQIVTFRLKAPAEPDRATAAAWFPTDPRVSGEPRDDGREFIFTTRHPVKTNLGITQTTAWIGEDGQIRLSVRQQTVPLVFTHQDGPAPTPNPDPNPDPDDPPPIPDPDDPPNPPGPPPVVDDEEFGFGSVARDMIQSKVLLTPAVRAAQADKIAESCAAFAATAGLYEVRGGDDNNVPYWEDWRKDVKQRLGSDHQSWVTWLDAMDLKRAELHADHLFREPEGSDEEGMLSSRLMGRAIQQIGTGAKASAFMDRDKSRNRPAKPTPQRDS
jgi:hypothetical protein